MKKIAIFAHCAIDTITINNNGGDATGSDKYEQIGGSACYCSITARQLNLGVELFTKFGADFPAQYLTQNAITTMNATSQKDTTRFYISVTGSDKTLRLGGECEAISHYKSDADGHIVSPIFHEITDDTLSKIKKDARFLLVDPQGFLRRSDQHGNITMGDTNIDLSGVDAVKADPQEASHIIAGSGISSPSQRMSHDEMMLALQKMGAKYVLFTNKADVSLLTEDKVYSITLPNKQVYDTTGIGDIFCSAFVCTMLKENDFLWALCFAGGAAQAAIDAKAAGLQKIPKKGKIQTNASYFYNLVKFRDL